MGSKHSKATVIFINGVEVSSTSAGCGITDSNCGVTMKTEDNTTYGKDAEVYGPTLYSGEFGCGGKYQTGATGPRALFQPLVKAGTEVTIKYRPEGTGSGLPQSMFQAILTKYVETAPVAGYRLWTLETQPSDTWDDTAQA